MYYSPAVNVFQGQAKLNEPIENLGLRKVLIFLDLPLDVIAEVAYLAIFHNDDQEIQCEVALLVRYDVRVIEVLQKIDLKHGSLFFFILKAL